MVSEDSSTLLPGEELVAEGQRDLAQLPHMVQFLREEGAFSVTNLGPPDATFWSV